jgi:hypothetical protein
MSVTENLPARVVRVLVVALVIGWPSAASAAIDGSCTSDYFFELFAWFFSSEAPRCAGFRGFDLAFLAAFCLSCVAVARLAHSTARRRIELARRMVEQGMDPPAELWERGIGTDLRRGIVLIATGLGFVAASWAGGPEKLGSAGLVPGFIGLGYLLSHRLSRKTSK